MANSRTFRVAIFLEMEWPLKRHVDIFAGTQRYAQRHGWESMVDQVIIDKLPQRPTKSLAYQGIIGRITKPLAEHAIRLGLPVVNVWWSSPARELLPGVFPDFQAAGHLQAEHLLTRGLRSFGTITNRGDQGQELQMKQFRHVVEEAGCTCKTANVALHALKRTNWRATEQAITSWMDNLQPPFGLYVGDEMIGRLVAQLCSDRGWHVPQDVAISTGQNTEIICAHPRPSLTSVEMNYNRIGYEAAQLLDQLMREKESGNETNQTGNPRHRLIPPQALVVRESTDFFAVDDKLVAAALEYIAANGHRQIGPEDVAQVVATELRTLQRRFRAHLDRSIAAEIRRVRIERAKRELAQTDESIKSIARSVGFGTPMQMYQVFSREVGITPTEYRKRQRSENAP